MLTLQTFISAILKHGGRQYKCHQFSQTLRNLEHWCVRCWIFVVAWWYFWHSTK